jgi:hypothetical protein
MPLKPTFVRPRPARQIPDGYHIEPPDQTSGGTYRVRDKDWVAVWGENMSFDEANKLKEQVIGRGKSKTARVESMDVDPPDWYYEALAEQAEQSARETAQPDEPRAPRATPPSLASQQDRRLQELRQKAIDTAAAAARSAEARAALRANPASPPTPRGQSPKRPVPVVSTVTAEEEKEELGFDVSEVAYGSGSVSDDDIKREKARLAAEAAKRKPAPPRTVVYTKELIQKAKTMYEAQMRDGHLPWNMLNPKVQDGWKDAALKVREPQPAVSAPPAEPTDPEPDAELAVDDSPAMDPVAESVPEVLAESTIEHDAAAAAELASDPTAGANGVTEASS